MIIPKRTTVDAKVVFLGFTELQKRACSVLPGASGSVSPTGCFFFGRARHDEGRVRRLQGFAPPGCVVGADPRTRKPIDHVLLIAQFTCREIWAAAAVDCRAGQHQQRNKDGGPNEGHAGAQSISGHVNEYLSRFRLPAERNRV